MSQFKKDVISTLQASGKSYGKRICMQCQKEFDAVYLQQVCCSDDCRIARENTQHTGGWNSYKNKYNAILVQMTDLMAENAALKVRIAELEKQAAESVAMPKMQTCERMKLKAVKLPCGEREECHMAPVCDKAKGKVKK